ncbi:hypothetical protein GPECTOR_1g306 [Gonium pectorale]|uniref:Uncharacterized protein n=1 Tax=Gonium pectorale TaxID=33097 RepID=A0A150H2E9_GONPE|nr:hypothetical protein GPECTOR_1g306 [Gonium pectorale]|eukprot:KXZ56346.1 hypothetical protein GPECTOR_1g306 [Gonium pectorale]
MPGQKNMPRAISYCMWGVRLPSPAAAAVAAAEGGALEAAQLSDPDGTGMPLLLFPALLLVLSGDELLTRLDADCKQQAAGSGAGSFPLSGLLSDVRRAHAGASLLVYVVGLEEAMRRRERGNKSFSRAAVEDLLFDMVVGMPAVRLQFDCPESSDHTRAATELLNLGWALSQQPRRRTEAYLETFGSKSTVPLRAVKEVLSQEGGPEQLALCDALSCLMAPQRAAAVAAEHPSLAALLEALKAKPAGPARESMLARLRIPGVTPGARKQLYAGPAASASIARFLGMQNGREEWKDAAE